MAVIKKAPSDIAAKIAAYVLTAGFALLCILPMWHVIMASLSDPIQLAIYEGFLFKPLKFSFEGYKLLFSYHNLWLQLFQHGCLYGQRDDARPCARSVGGLCPVEKKPHV